ncbi:MAG TPA: aspartate aminotransferase family protein [Candidatus Gallimonas gallistercoris]|uniref:Aspartate aminotransferase family protein n=1 Tax=Candidatus Gallimonas gallistercoris TaxID=2838602 RepID=A0A9D2H367_9FIRM|nr:aspartate aminotransferase family protein [Candidatus Gallimonas gallistercoris]
MEFSTLQQLENTYMAETFSRFPVAIERGEGATLFDTEGKRYVDFGSGIAVNIFGANDEKWKAAVIDQLSRIQHVSNYYYSEPQLDLAELLCFRTGAKRVFFANSGAEANECALKAARKYSFEKYGEGRKKIISLNGSFHGRTLFTLTATGQEAFHRFFGPFVPEVVSVDANMQAVEKESENACAVIIECVQGESGVEALDKGFVRALRTFCDEHDILLICDEVQSGNGRTGKFCAYEHYGITPDIMTTAKGLGGGLPIGACLFFEKTEHTLKPGDHGSTFGGNPVCCAGAVSIVSRLTEDFLLEVQGKAEYLRAKLMGFDGVKRVTGLGLMIGLEVEKPAKEIAQNCLKRGLLVLTAHEKVRIVPPLNISKTEMDEGLTILREVLAQ